LLGVVRSATAVSPDPSFEGQRRWVQTYWRRYFKLSARTLQLEHMAVTTDDRPVIPGEATRRNWGTFVAQKACTENFAIDVNCVGPGIRNRSTAQPLNAPSRNQHALFCLCSRCQKGHRRNIPSVYDERETGRPIRPPKSRRVKLHRSSGSGESRGSPLKSSWDQALKPVA
jgi:hypothetical protein